MIKLIMYIFLINFTYINFSYSFVFKNTILPNKIVSHFKMYSHDVYTDESFHGIWSVDDDYNKSILLNLCPNGKIENPENLDTFISGVWYTSGKDITLVTFGYNSIVSNIYYGKTIDDNHNTSICIKGTKVYGSESPDFISKFTMKPLFPLFHNITIQNKTSSLETVDNNNITGKWLLENVDTNSIYIIMLYENYTWESNNYNSSLIGGKWNLYNSHEELDLLTGIHKEGDYIWLWAQKLGMKGKNRLNLIHDILFLGKITHLTNAYYDSQDIPSSYENDVVKIASKINGTVIHSFNNEPEISETFYMVRWWD